MQQKISQEILHWREDFQKEVEKNLPPTDHLSAEEARGILRRYVAAIQPNFLAWMAGAIVFSKNSACHSAASENMKVELRDDHPGMLWEFARNAGGLPEGLDFETVFPAIKKIREIVSHCSGLQCLALMALLEGGSVVFAPYLGKIAGEILNSKNITYATIHGEADKDHADMFLAALTCEKEMGYIDGDKQIREVWDATLTLLCVIFSK